MKEKRKKTGHLPGETKAFMLGFLMVILFAGAVIFWQFQKRVSSSLDMQAEYSLKSVSSQNALLAEVRIQDRKNLLRAIANEIAETEPSVEKEVLTTLKSYAENFGFYSMGIVDQNGICYTILGETLDLSQYEYFQKTMEGKEIVTEGYLSENRKNEVNIFTMPINRNTGEKMALTAVYRTEDFLKMMDIRSFDGKGGSIVVDSKGKLISGVSGSNAVLLRKALDEIGGFPYGTITEDFETSIRLQKAGYITYATSKVLASGLSTTTVKSMIRQRIRWARGVIQSIRNTNAVFTRKLSLAGKLSYLNAYFYWWSFFNRMIFILAPILFALFDFQLARCGFWELMIFWLPSHLWSSMSMRYLSTNIRNMRWSQIIDTILAPYLIFPVLLESIGIRQKKFKVTEKKKTSKKTTSIWYILPHGLLIVLSIAAILRYVKGKYGLALLFSSVILFWLLYNLIALTYAVFFMLDALDMDQIEKEYDFLIILDENAVYPLEDDQNNSI